MVFEIFWNHPGWYVKSLLEITRVNASIEIIWVLVEELVSSGTKKLMTSQRKIMSMNMIVLTTWLRERASLRQIGGLVSPSQTGMLMNPSHATLMHYETISHSNRNGSDDQSHLSIFFANPIPKMQWSWTSLAKGILLLVTQKVRCRIPLKRHLTNGAQRIAAWFKLPSIWYPNERLHPYRIFCNKVQYILVDEHPVELKSVWKWTIMPIYYLILKKGLLVQFRIAQGTS